MKIENVKLADLIPYNKNAKKHDKTQIDNVAASIKNYGFVQPIVIDKNNIIVIGHCRALAAEKLHIKEVPCFRAEDLTEEQINALRIVDNKTNESDWDMDYLIEELANINLDDFDFDFGLDGIKEDAEESVKLEEKYQLIIDCETEEEMQENYDKILRETGIECRISTL